MKEIIFILLIICLHVGYAESSYENYLGELWEKVSTDREITYNSGFLPKDIKSFFEENMDRERALIFFYPTRSNMDRLVTDSTSFIDLEEFFYFAKVYGFEIKYCSSHRHLVSFKSLEERNNFIINTLQLEPKEEEIPLYFPCRMIIAELIKK